MYFTVIVVDAVNFEPRDVKLTSKGLWEGEDEEADTADVRISH